MAGRHTERSLLLPMSMMVMLGFACCLASSSQLARWLKVSRLHAGAQCLSQRRDACRLRLRDLSVPQMNEKRGPKERAGRPWRYFGGRRTW